jgi:hypothetical protein
MRRAMLALVVGLAAAFPSAASSQVPLQDSVSLTGTAVTTFFTVTTLCATSGPSGENPSGQVEFSVLGVLQLGGPVTCLAVSSNTATLNFQDEQGGFGIVTVQVTDNQPDTFDSEPIGRTATDCSPLPPSELGGPITSGDITVVDAPPLPTSKDQCKNGGWQIYGFKNQGDCFKHLRAG